MCTAISLKNGNHYFGRNLDLEYSYCEAVTITPRNFSLQFKKKPAISKHYAIIGMAYVKDGYPLYYDGVNEKGLSMAGLSFWDYAYYGEEKENSDNISPFEFIPWILSQCRDIKEASELLSEINLVNIDFSDELPLSPLHWMISDKESSLVIEATNEGVKIYDNPVGVLTNNPPFDYQIMNLNNYRGLSNNPSENTFSPDIPMYEYSRGMGGIGLPGDLSSQSRFVRAAFLKENSVCGDSEEENVSQFFHILDSVAHPRGSVRLSDGKYEITVYSSCCNTEEGIYYYTTYENRQITAVSMKCENIDSDSIVSYPIITKQQIFRQNNR